MRKSDFVYEKDLGIKRAIYKMRGQIAQLFPCVGLRQMDFLNIPGGIMKEGRNRPTFAIRAQVGLFGTSLSLNCWVVCGILRKSHFPAQDDCVNNCAICLRDFIDIPL